MGKFERLVVIAPTRSTALNISIVLGNGTIPQTLLMQEKGNEILQAVDQLEQGGFGVVAGTGTGKTVSIRDIANKVLGQALRVDLVTREHEATDYTWTCNVLVVTPGVAMHWFKSGVLSSRDLVVIDEIHQTSDHLELTMALAKRAGCQFLWMSATIDPTVYASYLNAKQVISCNVVDETKRAKVECVDSWGGTASFLDSKVKEFINGKRGVAVFVPTRAEAEALCQRFSRCEGLQCEFYHGGESAERLRKFLKGQVQKPFMIFMTIAGASSLNILGLDTVVIVDEWYTGVVHSGVLVTEKRPLGANELLQMGGRVNGRVSGGQIYILTSRNIDFHSLKPVAPQFVLGGDLERVALTCARLEIDASQLDLICPIDRNVYETKIKRFRLREIIQANADGLTSYGEQVERLPVPASWAELIVKAQETDNDSLLDIVVTCACIETLYDMVVKDCLLRDVRVSGSNHLTAYNIVALAMQKFCKLEHTENGLEYVFSKQLEAWCREQGFRAKTIKEVAIALKSVYRQLDLELLQPKEFDVVEKDSELHKAFLDLLAKTQSLDFVHSERNSQAGTVFAASESVCGVEQTLGTIRFWKDKRGYRRASVEGTEIPTELVQKYSARKFETFVGMSTDGRKIIARYCATFANEQLQPFNVEMAEAEIPADRRDEARSVFCRWLVAQAAYSPRQTRAHELNVRAGNSIFKIFSRAELETWMRERVGEALTMESVADPKVFDLPKLDEQMVELVIRENPDQISLLSRQFAVTYREGCPPSITLEGEASQMWQQLPDSGVFLPNDRALQVTVSFGYYSRISQTDIPLLKRQVREHLNASQWSNWQKPAITLPNLEDEAAQVPEITTAQYGACVVDGTPLLAFGVVSPNRNRYYSNDPWFKGEWYQSRDEAEKARQGIVEKLAEMRKQARELREAEQLKAEAESARQELQGLYSHEGWNSLNWNFREEVDRQHYSSLPSSTQEIRKWIVQTKALCAKVEATIAENIRARQEEARQKAEVERAEREELAVVLQWTGDNLETAREIRAFAQAIAEIKGASEGAKILRQELNAPYGRARRQGNISYLVRGLSDTDAGQRFLSLYRASDADAWIAGAAAWLESKLEKSDNKSQAKPVELSTVTTLFGVAVQQSSKRRKK